MAVFTEVPFEAAHGLIARLGIGELQRLEGCPGGIENTNYFADTTAGRYVLTLFERLSAEQLPFYLHYMKHLAQRDIPVPDPQADAQGEILHHLLGKPAAVVNRLRGRHRLAPDAAHCAAVGEMLARMHLAGQDFALQQPNLRGLAWWNSTAPVVMPFLEPAQAALLQSELAYQNHVAAGSRFAALPRGPIHADLFRDNVLFDTPPGHQPPDGPVLLSGFFDFYFAGVDSWLFDIGVCLNDWCVDLDSGAGDQALQDSFLRAYAGVRPLSAAEHRLLPAMQRAGALRFWISRLWDLHLPREASMLKPHDPSHFERVLRQRIDNLGHR